MRPKGTRPGLLARDPVLADAERVVDAEHLVGPEDAAAVADQRLGGTMLPDGGVQDDKEGGEVLPRG